MEEPTNPSALDIISLKSNAEDNEAVPLQSSAEDNGIIALKSSAEGNGIVPLKSSAEDNGIVPLKSSAVDDDAISLKSSAWGPNSPSNALWESNDGEEDEEWHAKPAQTEHICRFCGDEFASKNSLGRHVTEQHDSNGQESKHICRVCGVDFSRKGSLDIHMREQHGPNGRGSNHICHVCGIGFAGKASMTRHVRIRHESIRARPGRRRKPKTRHIRIRYEPIGAQPGELRHHVCGYCSVEFHTHQSMTHHVRSIHESDATIPNHVCQFCGARFARKSGVTYHLRRVRHDLNSQHELPHADHQTHLLVDNKEDVRAEPPEVLPDKVKREPEVVDLTAEDLSISPTIGRPAQHRGPSAGTPAGSIKATPGRVRLDQNLSNLHSSPEVFSHTRRSARLRRIKTPDYAKSAKCSERNSPLNAKSPEVRSAEPKKSTRKRLLPDLESRRTRPRVSVEARLPSAPEPQASQTNPSSNKNILFHFFLADESHGAIPQPLESCKTMTSFFEEALAAWGALGGEQPQPRMIAVKVIMEGVSRPIVVLWRNKDGFERMMATILEQAADRQTKFNVEVRCFKRG